MIGYSPAFLALQLTSAAACSGHWILDLPSIQSISPFSHSSFCYNSVLTSLRPTFTLLSGPWLSGAVFTLCSKGRHKTQAGPNQPLSCRGRDNAKLNPVSADGHNVGIFRDNSFSAMSELAVRLSTFHKETKKNLVKSSKRNRSLKGKKTGGKW